MDWDKIIWQWRGTVCRPAITEAMQLAGEASQNQINVPDVKTWATELQKSLQATEYELQLIGPISAGVAALREFGSVRIPTPQPLNLQGLVDQASHKLDHYMQSQGLPRLTP